MVSWIGAAPIGVRRSRISPWHDAQSRRASVTWRRCEKFTCEGRRVTCTHAMSRGSALWHFAQNAADGMPARAAVVTPRWQTAHATPWCFTCGNAIGWCIGAGGAATSHAAAATTAIAAAVSARRMRLLHFLGFGGLLVVERLLARLRVVHQELEDLLAVVGADERRAGLAHHPLDVALPLVIERELAVDRARDRVAAAALLREQRILLLHVGRVLRDVDLRGPLVVRQDARIDLIVLVLRADDREGAAQPEDGEERDSGD